MMGWQFTNRLRMSVFMILVMALALAPVLVGVTHHFASEHLHHQDIAEASSSDPFTGVLTIGHSAAAEHEHQLSAIMPAHQNLIVLAPAAWQPEPAHHVSDPAHPPPRRPPRPA